ncbi:MAG: DNA mismatch repair protein MutS, partial [Enterobacteriaceae bacterium]|nr:DNA mismatch repair protein MutS [Enterobacteriaceae bacterium]
ELLDIVLTSRGTYLNNPIPMCGFPVSSADNYILKLIKNKKIVAICEQISDLKLDGLIERKVVRILTPGTVVDENYLTDCKNNFICGLSFCNDMYGIAVIDITTGYFFLNTVNSKLELLNELDRISPVEILVSDKFTDFSLLPNNSFIHILSSDKFNYKFALDVLSKCFNKIELLKVDSNLFRQSVISAGCLLDFVLYTQNCNLCNLNTIEIYDSCNLLYLDRNSRRDLELFRNLRGGNDCTLLSSIDFTLTSMGRRLLIRWINSPILSRFEINYRLLSVSALKINQNYLKFYESLKKISDIERILGRIVFENVKPKDLKKLEISLKEIPLIREQLKTICADGVLKTVFADIDSAFFLSEFISNVIVDNPVASIKDGNVIKDGYDVDLDEYRRIYRYTGKFVLEFENIEKLNSNIPSLKIKCNNEHEYFIEISKNKAFNIPYNYKLIKSLVSKNRYVTDELKVLEKNVLNSKINVLNREKTIYNFILFKIKENMISLQKISEDISILDVIQSFAKNSNINNWCEPLLVLDNILEIESGRHPVIEVFNSSFIPNDCLLTPGKKVLIITGANMGGKSTYMRQTAIIILLAHIGSHVPALRAKIGFIDKIFTRIGSCDDLANSTSTFMLEMKEIDAIIRNSTSNSFVLIDEIGRGTGFIEGLSLAWSIISYLIKNINPYILVSTHFYELSELSYVFTCVDNIYFAVLEYNTSLVFLYKFKHGVSSFSYSLNVAKIAGLPDDIIISANEKLIEIKNKKIICNDFNSCDLIKFNKIFNLISCIDCNDLSFKQAIDKISLLKDIIDGR